MLIRLYHIRYLSQLLHYSIYILLTSIFAQSDGNFDGSINNSEVYFKNLNFEWKPYNQESHLHSLDLSELRLGFSDIKTTFTYNDSIATSNIMFSGPNITLKSLILNSKIKSPNWITEEKIRRLEKRESIPKESIDIIANAVDIFKIDHDTLPSDLNQLIINQYISMQTPPLNNYSWSYTLDLPNKIISEPTFLNILPNRDAIVFDWNTKSYRLSPLSDSLFNVPMANWDYQFKINDVSQILASDMYIEMKPDSLGFDLMMEYGRFKISGISFTAIPNSDLNERSSIKLPELTLEVKDVALNNKPEEIPTFHKGNYKFKVRNFEIKLPEDLKEEPEIQRMLETMGIWNNSLMLRVLDFEINLINQFAGELEFKFQTPFIKISIIGDFGLRQNGTTPDIRLHDVEVRIHPISLGIRKWLKEWEKKNNREFNRVGATIVLKINGSLKEPLIQGY